MKTAKVIGPIVWACLLSCVTRGGQAADAEAPAPLPTTAVAESTAAKTPPPIHQSACPDDMVEVDGDYCPDEEQVCFYNTDINNKRKPGPGDLTWACGEYKNPTQCRAAKVHMHFCIDRYEWPNKAGEKPQDWMTWYDAKHAVESVGKRLCTHKEWSLAAEGPDMHPLPYGDGYHRGDGIISPRVCNFDNDVRLDVAMQSKTRDDAASQKLRALLVPSGSMPDCVSDFGVHDMAGNIDEWVVNEASNILECPPEVRAKDHGKGCGLISYRSGLMGGHVWHVRNASRPMTTAHNASFGWYETGTRACKDVQ